MTKHRRIIYLFALIAILLFAALPAVPASAAPAASGTTTVATPYFRIDLNGGGKGGRMPMVLEIFLLMTILSLAPALLIMLTAFTRIVMVLSLLRQAIGTNQMPPNQVIIGLSLFLTLFVMSPVITNINQNALQPYLHNTMSPEKALDKSLKPIRRFMFRQTSEKDLALFVKIAKLKRPRNREDIPMTVLIPAFIISEVKTAFEIGLLLYVPFLIIDMVVASVLLSMGMMMLPPVMVSLPFKLMLFVLADGWYLIIGSLVRSFH